jgi:hypothetical protein
MPRDNIKYGQSPNLHRNPALRNTKRLCQLLNSKGYSAQKQETLNHQAENKPCASLTWSHNLHSQNPAFV